MPGGEVGIHLAITNLTEITGQIGELHQLLMGQGSTGGKRPGEAGYHPGLTGGILNLAPSAPPPAGPAQPSFSGSESWGQQQGAAAAHYGGGGGPGGLSLNLRLDTLRIDRVERIEIARAEIVNIASVGGGTGGGPPGTAPGAATTSSTAGAAPAAEANAAGGLSVLTQIERTRGYVETGQQFVRSVQGMVMAQQRPSSEGRIAGTLESGGGAVASVGAMISMSGAPEVGLPIMAAGMVAQTIGAPLQAAEETASRQGAMLQRLSYGAESWNQSGAIYNQARASGLSTDEYLGAAGTLSAGVGRADTPYMAQTIRQLMLGRPTEEGRAAVAAFARTREIGLGSMAPGAIEAFVGGTEMPRSLISSEMDREIFNDPMKALGDIRTRQQDIRDRAPMHYYETQVFGQEVEVDKARYQYAKFFMGDRGLRTGRTADEQKAMDAQLAETDKEMREAQDWAIQQPGLAQETEEAGKMEALGDRVGGSKKRVDVAKKRLDFLNAQLAKNRPDDPKNQALITQVKEWEKIMAQTQVSASGEEFAETGLAFQTGMEGTRRLQTEAAYTGRPQDVVGQIQARGGIERGRAQELLRRANDPNSGLTEEAKKGMREQAALLEQQGGIGARREEMEFRYQYGTSMASAQLGQVGARMETAMLQQDYRPTGEGSIGELFNQTRQGISEMVKAETEKLNALLRDSGQRETPETQAMRAEIAKGVENIRQSYTREAQKAAADAMAQAAQGGALAAPVLGAIGSGMMTPKQIQEALGQSEESTAAQLAEARRQASDPRLTPEDRRRAERDVKRLEVEQTLEPLRHYEAETALPRRGQAADVSAAGTQTRALLRRGFGGDDILQSQMRESEKLGTQIQQAQQDVDFAKQNNMDPNVVREREAKRDAMIEARSAFDTSARGNVVMPLAQQAELNRVRFIREVAEATPGSYADVRGSLQTEMGILEKQGATISARMQDPETQKDARAMFNLEQESMNIGRQQLSVFNQLQTGWEGRLISQMISGPGDFNLEGRGFSLRDAVGAGVRTPHYGSTGANLPFFMRGAGIISRAARPTGFTGPMPGGGTSIPGYPGGFPAGMGGPGAGGPGEEGGEAAPGDGGGEYGPGRGDLERERENLGREAAPGYRGIPGAKPVGNINVTVNLQLPNGMTLATATSTDPGAPQSQVARGASMGGFEDVPIQMGLHVGKQA